MQEIAILLSDEPNEGSNVHYSWEQAGYGSTQYGMWWMLSILYPTAFTSSLQHFYAIVY